MDFRFVHNNINVANLERSLLFYKEALGLVEIRRKEAKEFSLVYLGDGITPWRLELTWLKSHSEPYDLGENETHFCLCTDHNDESLAKHKAMGCVCFENQEMGIYFIEDPDGYWVEIVPG